jgi:hypothetical protein
LKPLLPYPLFPFTLIVIVLCTLFNARQVQAQSGIELENVGATVQFGEQIIFDATVKSSIPIQSAMITIFDDSQGLRLVQPLSVQPDGHVQFILDTTQTIIRPFSELHWSYQFTFSDGSTSEKGVFSVRYADDRFTWQTLESGSLRVHWYNGDLNFGHEVLDTIQSGLSSVSRLVAVDLAQPIEFYIYANAIDLRGTLTDEDNHWIAGHADPALGVVMVAITPGPEQKIVMEQRIPHELMHVMMARAVGARYQNTPAWLREGTAALAEIYPNPDYDRVLTDAVASGHLIALQDLCASFPADTGQAFLAYAESRSFTNYLHETFGSSGLLKLASSYADGVDCERGAQLALGISLSTLETRWHASALGQTSLLPALQNLTPYLVLLCLVLIVPLLGILTTRRKKGSQNESKADVRK